MPVGPVIKTFRCCPIQRRSRTVLGDADRYCAVQTSIEPIISWLRRCCHPVKRFAMRNSCRVATRALFPAAGLLFLEAPRRHRIREPTPERVGYAAVECAKLILWFDHLWFLSAVVIYRYTALGARVPGWTPVYGAVDRQCWTLDQAVYRPQLNRPSFRQRLGGTLSRRSSPVLGDASPRLADDSGWRFCFNWRCNSSRGVSSTRSARSKRAYRSRGFDRFDVPAAAVRLEIASLIAVSGHEWVQATSAPLRKMFIVPPDKQASTRSPMRL